MKKKPVKKTAAQVAVELVELKEIATVAKSECHELRTALKITNKQLEKANKKAVDLAVKLARWIDLSQRLALRLRQWCSYDEVVVTKADHELLTELARLNEDFGAGERH